MVLDYKHENRISISDHTKVSYNNNTYFYPTIIIGKEYYNFIKVITEDTSRLQFPKFTINRSTLRSCFTVVICQLSRWRLLPTTQTMKKARDTGGRKEMKLSSLQWEKEPIPTCLNPSGSVTDVREEQSANALCPTWITVSGSVTERRLTHCRKALSPIIINFFGSMMEERAWQKANAWGPISVTASDSVTQVRPSHAWKTRIPTLVKLFGRVIEVREKQQLNASSPIWITVSGSDTEVRCSQSLKALPNCHQFGWEGDGS